MGHTNYFQFNIPIGVKASTLETKYRQAIIECSKLALAWNAECKVNGTDWARLSGYTAHTKPGAYGGVDLNGKGSESAESFSLREHFRQNTELDFTPFCKTYQRPYDTVVKACLALLKHRLGNAISVSSDGRVEDWNEGVLFARRITRLSIPNPLDTKRAYASVCRKSKKKPVKKPIKKGIRRVA